MSFLANFIKRRKEEKKREEIFRKHGELTKYHLEDPCFEIGDFTYGIPRIERYDKSTKLSIGKYTSIGGSVAIMLGGNHFINRVSTYPFFREKNTFTNAGNWEERFKGDVRIGNDVWIGREAFILPGVTIGDGAVIGARAIVAKDIPPYAIAVGNPAKVIKYRFSPETIQDLLSIKWWNWDVKKINENLHLINSSDISEFISKFKQKI